MNSNKSNLDHIPTIIDYIFELISILLLTFSNIYVSNLHFQDILQGYMHIRLYHFQNFTS